MLYFPHHVPHRDISLSNILFVFIADKIKDRYGFLIDFDYTTDVTANTLVCKLIFAPYKIKTLP